MVDGITPLADTEPAVARQRLAAELTQVVLRAERRLGRGIDRAELARRVNVSTGSLYAYLNGTTLPPAKVFDLLITTLGVTGHDAGRLGSLRDAVEIAQRVGRRRHTRVGRDMAGEPSRSHGPGPGPVGPTGRRRVGGLSEAAASGRATTAVPPRQLPPATREFIGRRAELDELDRLVERQDSSPSGTIVTIDGTAGVGKTTLALRWSYRVVDHYPDGQLYVNLRGFDPRAPMEPEHALHGFLHALGVAATAIPADLDARTALFRSLLAQRRMLVLLDNARSADHVRPLLAGSPTCLTVVTSRDSLEGMVVRNGACRLELGVLPHSDALELLGRRLTSLCGEARPALDELAQQCAHLPLALSIAGARAAGRSDESLDRLVTELRQVRARLDFLGSWAPPTPTSICARCSDGPTSRCPHRRPGFSGCSEPTRDSMSTGTPARRCWEYVSFQ